MTNTNDSCSSQLQQTLDKCSTMPTWNYRCVIGSVFTRKKRAFSFVLRRLAQKLHLGSKLRVCLLRI